MSKRLRQIIEDGILDYFESKEEKTLIYEVELDSVDPTLTEPIYYEATFDSPFDEISLNHKLVDYEEEESD